MAPLLPYPAKKMNELRRNGLIKNSAPKKLSLISHSFIQTCFFAEVLFLHRSTLERS